MGLFLLLINVMIYYMCLLIWTVFSGERCGPWASCSFIFMPVLMHILSFWSKWGLIAPCIMSCYWVTEQFTKVTIVLTHLFFVKMSKYVRRKWQSSGYPILDDNVCLSCSIYQMSWYIYGHKKRERERERERGERDERRRIYFNWGPYLAWNTTGKFLDQTITIYCTKSVVI